jgi:hypothetical protein
MRLLTRVFYLSSVLALVAACASRLPAPANRLSTAVPVGFGAEVRLAFDSVDAFHRHAQQDIARLRAHTTDGKINALVISGGGAGGAFGAGALKGLSDGGRRPTFHLVTGVSVGALTAPFAFLGPEWDPVLTQALSGEASEHMLQRNLLGVLFGSSMYRGQPLKDTVDRFVTDELVAAVARESARGRRLLVATTDLDKGEAVIWDMGAIAQRGGAAARELFSDVLVASASIPFVYPPVLIRVTEGGKAYDEMHADGGTAMQLFLAPNFAVMSAPEMPRNEGSKVFVIANTQLGRIPDTVELGAMSIMERGFETNLTYGVRSALVIAISVAESYGMELEMTAIPVTYPYGGPLDLEPANMRTLFDFAARCAASGSLWISPEDSYRRGMALRPPEAGREPECPAGASASP